LSYPKTQTVEFEHRGAAYEARLVAHDAWRHDVVVAQMGAVVLVGMWEHGERRLVNVRVLESAYTLTEAVELARAASRALRAPALDHGQHQTSSPVPAICPLSTQPAGMSSLGAPQK
jgi:hypothetical protein